MNKIILLVCYFVVGCAMGVLITNIVIDSNKKNPLSTAQIAQKIQECRDYNMSVQWAYNGFTGEIHTISCIPSKEK